MVMRDRPEFFRPSFGNTRPCATEAGLGIYQDELLANPQILEWCGFNSSTDLLLHLIRGRILDLGSGASEAFSAQLRHLELQALAHLAISSSQQDMPQLTTATNLRIASVNPDYSTRFRGFLMRKMRNHDPFWLRQSTAAWGHALPYPDNVFRGEFAVSSVSLYAGPDKSVDYTRRWLSEIVRTLEPNGFGFVVPLLLPPGRKNYCLDQYKELADEVVLPRGDYLMLEADNIWRLAIHKHQEKDST
jgi:hypothetical protein